MSALDDLHRAAALLDAARPVAVRVDVGGEAFAAMYRGDPFPDELVALILRGLPPTLGPALRIVDDGLGPRGWRAFDRDGQVIAESTVAE